MAAVLKPQAEVNIPELAKSFLEKSGGNTVEAVQQLERYALQDVDVSSALLSPLLRQACYDAIRAVCRKERRAIWTAPNYSKGGNGGRVHEHASRLMDFILPNGIRLGEARRDEVMAATDFYRKQASDMSYKARWLEAIADKVEGKKMVKSCLSESDLMKLKESV